ncbi:MAG: hypothetical protein APF80_00030 [Alphaproteobacteria bacterium BRH_c36]|nr:MAG: hypothetical protein APF80_00030 [Alphaproteobacteria bacterium BRH_c36]
MNEDINQPGSAAMDAGIGHNAREVTFRIEVRLFNSLEKYAGPQGWRSKMEVMAGMTVGDIVTQMRVPRNEIFLVMRNGRDISAGLVAGPVNFEAAVEDGDVVAFLGPVPYSYGFGAPIV